MTSESLRIGRAGLPAAFVAALEQAGESPVAACVDFLRAAAPLLERGFVVPAGRTVVSEPAESGRGDHNGSYYYDGAFREGDERRFIEIETSYNRPEEMMYPETHTWIWRYAVRGLADGRQLELRCYRDALVGHTTDAAATVSVTGSAQECAAVLAAFRATFAGAAS